MLSSLPPPLRPALAGPEPLHLRPAPTADMQLRDFLLLLRRRKLMIAAGLCLGIAIAAVLAFTAQKEYSATATVEVNQQSGNTFGLSDLSGTASSDGGEDQMNTELLTQQAVIMSDSTALAVIRNLKLAAAPPYAPPAGNQPWSAADQSQSGELTPAQQDRLLNLFKSRLSVKLVKGTRLITVTYTDPDPARSAAVANAVIDAFTDGYTQARYQASSKTSAWLASQLTDLKNRVAESQAKVDAYQKQSGLAGVAVSPVGGENGESSSVIPSGNSVPEERLLELNEDLTKAEVSRIAKEAIYRMTQTQDPDVVLEIGSSALASGPDADSALSSGSTELAILQQLREQKEHTDVQLATLTTRYGAKYPLIVELRNEQSEEAGQIQNELARIRSLAKSDLDVSTLAEKSIEQRIGDQEQEVNATSAKTDQLLLLEQEAFSSRELYQDLYRKLQEASIVAGMSASNITLVSPARHPSRPTSPNRRMTLEIGATSGLLLGVVIACLWEHFDDSITNREQIGALTALPVVGLIPSFPEKRRFSLPRSGIPSLMRPQDAHAWLVRAPRSHVAEAYRSLRTALVMNKPDRPAKVLAVVSAGAQEGKSVTCFNVAAAFAKQGARVLYLDGDLRRSAANQYFEQSETSGLSEYLTETVELSDAIHPSHEIDTLFLMPAGSPPANPAELIGSERFTLLIHELREKYDYVFIDSPPLLFVTDGQLLSSLADGYFVVVRSGQTTKAMLQATLSLLEPCRPPALGIVLNAVNTRSPEYAMYKYYQKGRTYYVENPV